MAPNRLLSIATHQQTPCKTKVLAMALSILTGSGSLGAFCAVASLAAGGAVLFPQQVAAKTMVGFSPLRYKNGTTYGTGVFFAPYKFTVYSEPSETAAPVATFEWNRESTAVGVSRITPSGESLTAYPDRLFVCYYPAYDVAMMAVTSENGEGWAEVVYDQQKKHTGWVKLKESKKENVTPDKKVTSTSPKTQTTQTEAADPSLPEHLGTFQTWMEFMKFNGVHSGAYWLSGVSQYDKAMRSKNEDTAKLLSVTMIRRMKVRFLRGNWLLIEAQDFENHSPIGWVRWRDDDGNLMMFPNITGKPQSMITLY